MIMGLERQGVEEVGDGEPRIRGAGVHGVAHAPITHRGEGVADARVDERLHEASVLSGVPCLRIGSLVNLAARALLQQRRGCLAVARASGSGVRRVEVGT